MDEARPDPMPAEVPYTSGVTAMWLGIAALACTTVGFCLCYMPFVIAIPLALAAITLGYQTTSDASSPPLAVQMGRGGMVAGIIVLAFLFVLGAFFAMYVGMYVVIILLAVLSN